MERVRSSQLSLSLTSPRQGVAERQELTEATANGGLCGSNLTYLAERVV